MNIIVDSILIIVGFILLIKGADILVKGASSLAKQFNVPDIAIGMTVVAMCTSAPELVINLFSGSVSSAENGANEVVFGNIIGSNIFNIFLILGVSSVIYPLTVKRNTLYKEVPYSLLATIVIFVLVNDALLFDAEVNQLTALDGAVLLAMFIVFLVYTFMNLQRNPEAEIEDIEMYNTSKTTLMIGAGVLGLIFGGNIIVNNAVHLAKIFEVSDKLIGLTILATGTSLPELATSTVASFHKKSDLAIGNIIGSNIFNLLLVLGFTALVHAPLVYIPVLNIDLIIATVGILFLFLFMYTFHRFKLDRVEGLLYLISFFGYFYYLLARENILFSLF